MTRHGGGLVWIHPDAPPVFPPCEQALSEPNGLLAAGGDLSPERLISAYRQGIFPWYQTGQPILWWSPDPRAVLFPNAIRISRSLRKSVRSEALSVSVDQAFERVVLACADPRPSQSGLTWITDEMLHAYCRLHALGVAHSVEVWREGRLVGGLYGLGIGAAFFGESMFSRVNDASKIALVWLSRQLLAWGYQLIDCQVSSSHLQRLGAVDLPRAEFLRLLAAATAQPGQACGGWAFDPGFHPLQEP